jgi:hypothetical protein
VMYWVGRVTTVVTETILVLRTVQLRKHQNQSIHVRLTKD